MEKKIIHFETLGCRLNQDETEGAARAFVHSGYVSDLESVTASTEINLDTIFCVVNTCTVTGKAEQKARRIIRLLLEKYPRAVVLVTGCYAEVDGKSIKSICPNRVVVLKGTMKYVIAKIASRMAEDKDLFDSDGYLCFNEMESLVDSCVQSSIKPQKLVSLEGLNAFSLYTPVFEKHSRGSIKVQDGCNCACSFCRIHLARGKSISLDAGEVIRRVQQIESSGINEVVFTGVNLSQYSSVDESGNKIDFSDLLTLVLKNTSKIALRVSSFYPQSVNEKLCNVLADPRIQPFFHLSIQSGSDRILELMRRPHSLEHVAKSIELIRKAKENPFISCDIIAGFPGETEEDFSKTKKLCELSNFAWIHAFPYSPRPDTPAAVMKNQIPERIKGERVKWLTEKAVEGKIGYVNYWKGRTVSAIVENSRALRNSSEEKIIHAVTENFLHVECPVEDSREFVSGQKISVKIISPDEESIKGGKEVECRGVVVQ